MIGYFNNRKKQTLVKKINTTIKSDPYREYRGLQKDKKENYVGVVIYNYLITYQ